MIDATITVQVDRREGADNKRSALCNECNKIL